MPDKQDKEERSRNGAISPISLPGADAGVIALLLAAFVLLQLRI